MPDSKIDTVEQYLQAISQDGEKLTTAGTPQLYRGHSNASWELIPGIGRLDLRTIKGGWTWSRFEAMLLDEFWSLAVAHRRRPDSWIEELMIAQHYGLQTRLLDWSTSPLVALAFCVNGATSDAGPDGRVWIHRPPTAIQQTHRITKAPPPPSEDDEDRYVVSAHLAAPHISTRIAAQQACFTYHPLPLNRATFCSIEEASDDPSELRHVDIPRESMPGLSDQLAVLGFGPARLFPELPGIADEIKARLARRSRM